MKQGKKEVVEELLVLLRDDDSDVRNSTASALGKLGKKSPQILPIIVQWL